MARKLPKLRRVTQRPRKKLRDAPAKKSNADNQQLRKSEKMHKTKSIKLLLMLLLLIPLLTACAHNSTGSSVEPPIVPALPLEARQAPIQPQCSPTCSHKWKALAEQWRLKLTGVE
jgi:hypothetical protein